MDHVRLISQCIRCGTCCSKNPPTLHKQDLEFLDNSYIQFTNLITYRKGELVFDNINNRLINLEEEIVKFRTKEHMTACIFYDDNNKKCTIYKVRPMECRKLTCWNNENFLKFYKKDRINRFSVIKKDSAMGEIILEHEKKTSINRILNLYDEYKKKNNKNAEKELHEIISYDLSVREYIEEKTGAKKELDFIFGRSVLNILKIIGW